MLEERCNIWDKHAAHHPICITTNGAVNHSGACVMGRGVASQAKQRFPKLPYDIGARIKDKKYSEYGLQCLWLPEYNLFSFPVKYHWSDPADLELIAKSARGLMFFLNNRHYPTLPVYLPRPGCGNGHRAWEEVGPVISTILDNRVVVVTI